MTTQHTLHTMDELYSYIQGIIPSLTRNNDDAILLDAFDQNDISHVCQAIRETTTNQVTYQHLTLRLVAITNKVFTNLMSLNLYSFYLISTAYI
ncbi:hypothetical protein [Photobacterium angustum]|uniref:hypothetical protein n=1 Tax=Photobacterium angustum TaxID=661 RepID=UPI000A4BD27C|nr:hypothetical protein [Photobacterium angustum]